MVDIQVRVLGKVEIVGTGERLTPQSARILAVLVAAPLGREVGPEVLIGALWPDNSAPPALALPMLKLRKALPLGLEILGGRGGRGYRLESSQPGKVDVTDVVDRYRFQALVDQSEQLIGHGQVAEALDRLRQAADMWQGPPYSLGTDMEEKLPISCRDGRRLLEAQQEKLAKNWALAGLLSGEHDVLDWIQQDGQLCARLDGNWTVWLLRLADLLAAGDYAQATQVVQQSYRDVSHHMNHRGHELVELSKYCVDFQLRSVPTRELADHADHDGQADPECTAFTEHIAAVVARRAPLMHLTLPIAPTTLTVERMRAIAATAGARLLHVSCLADEPEVWRAVLREVLVAAIRDPYTPWDKPVRAAIEFADSTAALEPALADSSASVLRSVATRGPVVIVLQDAHLLGQDMAGLLDAVAQRIEGQPIGFLLIDGKSTEQRSASELLPPSRPGGPASPAPSVAQWLAVAAITEVDQEIDPQLVARVLGLTTTLADGCCAAAVRDGAVRDTAGSLRFTSSERLDTILRELATNPTLAGQLHGLAFTTLSQQPDSPAATPERLLWHARCARPALPGDVLAKARLAAAQDQLDQQQHDAAINHAISGLAVAKDHQCRFALHLVLGDAHHDRADMSAARTAYHDALQEVGRSPTLAATAVVRLARRWSDPGRVDNEILRLLRHSQNALSAAKDIDAPSRQLWLQVSAHLAHKSTMALPAGEAGAVPAGVALARTVIGELRPDDPPEMVSDVLTECRWALYDSAPPAELMEISSRLKSVAADPQVSEHFGGEALITTTIDQLRLGRLGEALASIAEHRQRTDQSRHGLMPWLQAVLDTLLDLWTGHLDTAQERLFGLQQDLLTEARHARTGDSLRQTWLAQVYWLRREQGRMSDLVSDGFRTLAEQREYFPVWSASTALLCSETGQADAAVDVIHALLDQTDNLRTLPPHGWSVTVLAVITEALDSLVRSGYPAADLVQFCERIDALLRTHDGELALAGWPAVLVRPVGQLRAMLALALGDFSAALAHLDGCARQVSRAPAQLGWFRFHKARALHGAGHVSSPQAHTLLKQALITAHDYNLAALCAAIQRYHPA